MATYMNPEGHSGKTMEVVAPTITALNFLKTKIPGFHTNFDFPYHSDFRSALVPGYNPVKKTLVEYQVFAYNSGFQVQDFADDLDC